MDNYKTGGGVDPILAAKFYPSGTKSEATSICLCGAVEIRIVTESPLFSGFCHCQACRRAHSAPLYQMLFVETSNFCPKTGRLRKGEYELTITKGYEKLRPAKMGIGNPNFQSLDVHPHIGGLGRIFCKDCSVIMMTAVFARPGSVFNSGDHDKEMVCVFPSTFTDNLSEFIQAWQPSLHVNCSSAILPLSAFNDGLAKWSEWADGVPWVHD